MRHQGQERMIGYFALGGPHAAQLAAARGDEMVILRMSAAAWPTSDEDPDGTLRFTFAWHRRLDELIDFLREFAPALEFRVMDFTDYMNQAAVVQRLVG